MATRVIDYDSWSLQDLKHEATKRSLYFSSMDGVKTLVSKLRTWHWIGQSFDAQERESLAEVTLETSLNFEQRLQLEERELQILELGREISQEHREIRELEWEVERERRQAERELERERREFESQKAQEEERCLVQEEERLRYLRAEKEEFAVREFERRRVSNSDVKKPKFIKIREMRESKDIDDFFRIFEMTASPQSLPEGEWVNNLVLKLTEKAKSIYLEIPDPACQDYHESKASIIKAYQLTTDH